MNAIDRILLAGIFIMSAVMLGIEIAWIVVMQQMGEMM